MKKTVKILFLLIIYMSVSLALAKDSDHGKQCVKDLSWYIPASKKVITPQKMIKKVRKREVVLLGEHHDNDEHHRWQLQAIVSLFNYHPDMVLAFEMFPRKVQPVLDQWIEGKLSEKAFLKQTEWNKHWTYDAQFYMPVFHFARMNKIPMRAVNIDRQFINRIQEEGLENIPQDERQGLRQPAKFSKEYISFMQAVFQKHGPKHDNKPKELSAKQKKMFDKFMQVQALWDGAMAQGIQKALQDFPGHQVVAMMGSGHMANGFGVPLQLKSLKINSIATLVPWHEQFQCDQLTEKFADVVIGLPSFKTPVSKAKPKLGIYMEPATEGVRIKKVYENTVASQTGLKDQDIILEMAGRPISNMGEIVEIVQGMVLGSWLPITVQRDDKKKVLVAKFPTRNEPN